MIATVGRWAIRLGTGLLVLALVAYGIRSSLMPDRTVFVLLQHAKGSEWLGAPQNPLFRDGQIEFAGHEPIQLAGEDLGDWDEVAVVSFQSAARYQDFLERIDTQPSLARYHVLLLAPMPPELLFLLNLRLRSFRDDASIDVGEQVPVEQAVPDPRYADRWNELFAGPYRDDLFLLNLIRHPLPSSDDRELEARNDPHDGRYEEKALPIVGKLGAQIDQAGTVESVVVGPDIVRYDEYGFAHYPSVDAFKVVFTAKIRVDATPHRHASLDRSAGLWVKPYEEFAGLD